MIIGCLHSDSLKLQRKFSIGNGNWASTTFNKRISAFNFMLKVQMFVRILKVWTNFSNDWINTKTLCKNNFVFPVIRQAKCKCDSQLFFFYQLPPFFLYIWAWVHDVNIVTTVSLHYVYINCVVDYFIIWKRYWHQYILPGKKLEWQQEAIATSHNCSGSTS